MSWKVGRAARSEHMPSAEWLGGDGEGTALGNGDCEKLKRQYAEERVKGIKKNGTSETKKNTDEMGKN